MKTLLAALAVVVMTASMAQAETITREGSAYNGIANPHGCKILVHDDSPTELHVSCLPNAGATGAARIRYRYLRPIIKGPATFTGEVEVHGGKNCQVSDVRWMADPDAPRTGRVRVPLGCYIHIVEVTWER